MLVSIIIPAYNAANFVGEAIASALVQQEVDTEIILVDNNSTDNTLDILHTWRKKHPAFIQVTQATIQGPSAARNVGLRLAKGEWIQFLDADDLLPPDKLAKQLALADKNRWIAASFTEIDLAGNTTMFQVAPDPWRGLATGVGIGCTCSNLFCRSALLEIGAYNESLPTGEDHDLYFRLLAAGFQPAVDLASRCTVRDRPENKQSRLHLPSQLARRIELHQRIHLYLLEKNPEYYVKNGDYLRAALLNHYRYWAAYSRPKAVASAKDFFPKIGGLPQGHHGLMPGWIAAVYRWLGFRRVEWLRNWMT